MLTCVALVKSRSSQTKTKAKQKYMKVRHKFDGSRWAELVWVRRGKERVEMGLTRAYIQEAVENVKKSKYSIIL